MRHNPYCLKIEPVRGCTRRCVFCSLSTIEWKEDPYQYMDMTLFRAIVDDLAGWAPKLRIEFEGRGEPSLHPELYEMARYARARLPKAQLTIDTNGDLIKKLGEAGFREWALGLLEAGFNIIVLDCYDRKRYEVMRDLFPEGVRYFETNTRITKKSPWVHQGPNYKAIYVLESTQENRNITREITNHAGNLDTFYAEKMGYHMARPAEDMRDKFCVKPFREMNIHYNGEVALCCLDWREQGLIGRFPVHTLKKLWDAMDAYRLNLVRRERGAQMPCANCNIRQGSRVWLEHNWFVGEVPSDLVLPMQPVAGPFIRLEAVEVKG